MTDGMIAFDAPSSDNLARAKAFGVGSAGCSMIARSAIPSVAFSTSEADLERSGAAVQSLITPQKLIGLYQADPAIIHQSPSVAGDEMHRLFDGTDIAFLLAGLGGVSGSLGTAVLGQLAKGKGALSIALVASPFSAESERRREFAAKCLRRIVGSTDACIVFGNDALSDLAPTLPLSKAFAVMNGIMNRPMLDICRVLDRNGSRILKQAVGEARYGRFGLGLGRGDERVQRAVDEAFTSPWFDFETSETIAAIAVYSAADPWDRERTRLIERVRQRLGDSKIMHGTYRDESLGDSIRLSLLLMNKL
ncbi:MAG: hypothetical protein OEM29_04085 [Thermoplasmata archaeon]|nr:hypothetical protein [Thermoplasmata archaeon]